MDFSNVADEGTIRIAEAFARGHASDPASDAKLFVEFSVEPLLNEAKSQAAGRPIFEDCDFISICRPGDKNDMVHRPVWMDPRHAYSDFHRFGKQYKAWKEGNATQAVGTPLSLLAQLNILTKSDVHTFLQVNVRTAEQFVSMADTDSQKYPGYSQLKQRVQAYLDKAKADAPALELKAALSERDDRIAAQDNAIKEMAAQLAELKRQKAQKQ